MPSWLGFQEGYPGAGLSSAANRSEEAGYPGANGLRVAGFGRNGWPECSGMGGRLGPEQVAGLVRRAQ